MQTKDIVEIKEQLLELIIKDAYYDYLGGSDYNTHSRNLYKELYENKIIEDDFEDWYTEQVDFIEKHSYYTETANKLRNSHKQKTIDHLKNRSSYH